MIFVLTLIVSFYLLLGLGITILIYWVRPRYPEWWEQNVAAPYPFEAEADHAGSMA